MTQMATSRGLSPAVDRVRRARGQALPTEGDVRLIDSPRYSRIAIPLAGLQNFTFFNDGPNTGVHVTNLPQPQTFITSGIYRAKAMAFHMVIAGDEEAGVDITAVDVARVKARYYEGGFIRVLQGDRKLLEDYGLFKWPSGGGVNFSGAIATTATTASHQAAFVNNGFPSFGNLRPFQAPIDLTKDDPLIVTVDYQNLIALPTGTTGVLMCTIYGDVVKEASAG